MKISLTGTTGFVGQNLCTYLSDAKYVLNPLQFREPILPKHLTGSDVVIHLAGKAHDTKNVLQPDEYYQVNYELTKQLYDTFLKSKATKFIFISSVKAAADSVDTPLTETHLPDPQTHYGISKLMAEQYLQSQQLPEGKACYILRPCMIHGPGNKGNLNLLYAFVCKGLPYPLAAFENKRSFLSVENLCFIIKEIIENDITPGIYNVTDDEPLSTKEVVSLIAGGVNKKPRLLSIPKTLISFFAGIGTLLRLPLNSSTLAKLTENYIVSNEKIKLAIQKQLPISSRMGIVKTIKSFSDNK